MKRFFTLCMCFISLYGNAQTIDDFLEISRQDYEGSARFASMGGAFGALGGDITTFSTNPAGIAVFRRHAISLTTSLNHISNQADYTGLRNNDTRTVLGLSNIGFMGVSEETEGGLKWSFGFSYLKKANYNKRTFAKSNYTTNSFLNGIANKANDAKAYFNENDLGRTNAFDRFGTMDWDVVSAYKTYLINWDDTDEGEWKGDFGENDRSAQNVEILRRGSSSEIVLTTGMNVKDKFYAGMTLGIPMIDYKHRLFYNENAELGNTSEFDRLNYNSDLAIDGYGFNLKMGFIYRLLPSLRIGAAFHTPDYIFTRFNGDEDDESGINSRYFSTMETYFKTPVAMEHFTSQPDMEYYTFLTEMNTPFKAIGSIAYTLKKLALFSFDCEYADYSRIKLKGYAPVGEYNNDIKKYFQSALTFRFGTEVWIKNIALRAGYIYSQSADKTYDLSRNTYSAGIGYSYKNFQFDLAYVQANYNEFYTPYYTANLITENIKNNRFSFTFGWRFSDYFE